MSWKATNNRNKTTSTDVIRCDELITDDIIAENATLNKKITISRNLTMRDLSITDISITTIIAVPDVSVNRIGENEAGNMIEFISPFSAPAAEITRVYAHDSSISKVSTIDLSVDSVNRGDNIQFYETDVSFAGNVEAHDACFNGIFLLGSSNLQFISDISTDETIYVSDISVDTLRGPINIGFDLSLHDVQNASDVSLSNNLDISLMEIFKDVGHLTGSLITIHSDVSFQDISALDLSVDVITAVSVIGDVSVNGDVSINGQIKAGGLSAHDEIVVTEDASFEHLHANDISVNNIYGTYASSDTSLVIHGDLSINNTNSLRIPMDPRDINQLKKKPLSAKKELAKDTFGIITENALYNSLIFRNNIGNFSTVKMDDLNVKRLTISQLTLTDGSFNNGYFATTDVSSHTLSGDLSGFSGGFVIGDHGYLVPDNSSVMVRFGLSNEDNVATDISLIDFDDLSGFSGGFSKDNFGYLVPDTSTTLVRYNASNDDVSKIVLNDDLSGFRGGFASDGSGYLVPHLGHKVVSFPLTDNSFTTDYVEDISLTDYFLNRDLSGFYGGFSSNNNIFLAPNSHSKLVKMKEDGFVNKDLSTAVLVTPAIDGTTLKDFNRGFAADGYGYLVQGGVYSSKVVRFDLETFSQLAVLDVADTVVTNTELKDTELKGFDGCFASGEYGYLVPHTTHIPGNLYGHGKVVRFKFNDFATADPTVEVLNVADTAVLATGAKDSTLKGFMGGFASGEYGYLVPYKSDSYTHGKVVRFKFDDFATANPTVEVLNVADTAVLATGVEDVTLKGFSDGFAADGYGYLVPFSNSSIGQVSKVVRFDLETFTKVEVLDVDNAAITSRPHYPLAGFRGGFAADGYGYLVSPIFSSGSTGGYSGNVVRFDLETFTHVEVLDVHDAAGTSSSPLRGFIGGFAAGDYGYLVPFYSATAGAATAVARFDLDTFTHAEALDLPDVTGDSETEGFHGGFAAGDYGYLVPHAYGKVVRFPTTTDFSSIDLSFTQSDPELTGFKGGFAHDNSGYLIPGENGKVVEFSTSNFSANNVNVIDFPMLTGDASLVKFSGGFKDETHGYLIPETFNKVARFDLSSAKIITSLDISVNGKDVSGFSGGFISGDYGYLVPNKSNELVRFSTNQNNTIINSDDFRLDTFKSNDPITIDKNRAYNLRIDFSYLMARDRDNILYEDVSMMVEIKPSSDISYFYNYDNSGSAGPGASEDISNVVRITDLSYSEAFNLTFARKSDTDLSMMITLRDNCNNDTAGNAVYKVIAFDVSDNNAAEEGNFDATYELALRDRNDLSFIKNDIDATGFITLNQRINYYNYSLRKGIKLFDEVLIEPWLSLPLPPPPPPMYVFSEHTFTNAGQSGRQGPSLTQLRTSYSPTWTNDINYLNVTAGIQEWTVPQTGMYEILAIGARGGHTLNTLGGAGASMQGWFELIRGTIIKILCGQMGYTNPTSADPGGGGGTFVVIDNNPILVAGGGGGGSTTQYSGQAGPDDRGDNVEKDAYIGTLAGPNNTHGADGGQGGRLGHGTSGAGFYTNGPVGSWAAVPGNGSTLVAAKSFLNGGVGGTSTHATPNVFGGFGGGGGAHGNTCIGGGGGGGYSGGTGADTQCVVGGGGSSFNSGTNQANTRSVGNDHGYVYIKKL